MSLFLGVAAGAAIAAPSPSSGASDIVPVIPDPLSGKEEQVTKLPNGLSVLILKDTRFPLVSTRLYVHAGSSYETPDQAGISHVLEHMVFKGTDSRPKSAISQEVESAGGYLNAATSYDYTVYITDMPDRHWKLGMDVVRDMAFHPTLDPQELESEKNVIVAELQRGEDDPGSRMFKTLLADTLKGTPYDRPIIGYEKTIRALTTQNLRDYIAKYYQPQNMLLVVVGNVDPAEVLAEAEKMFAPYKNTAPLKEVMPYEADRLPLPGSKPALVVQPGPWNKVYLAAALPVPGSSSYQSATLDVLAYLLGGDRTSLFYKTYKYERQLVDSISVSNVGFERIGAFVVTAELDADKVEPFWTSLTKDFAALDASTFTPEQLERAKLNLEDDLYRSKETLSGLASKIGYFQFFMGGDQGERNAIEALRNVDNGMLKQVLAAWVQPDRLTTWSAAQDAKMPDMQAILDKEWKSGPKLPQRRRRKPARPGHRSRQRPYRGAHPGQDPALRFREPDPFRRRRVEAFRTGPQRSFNVLTKGTAKRSATEMQAFLADRAAGLAASAGRKTFSVNLTTPARFNKDLFDLLGEVVTAPAFSKDETARGIKDQLAAIKSREDQPLGLAFRKLPPFLFPGSVYGYLQLGEPENVQKYDEAQLRSFWNRQKARPWVLAVSGDFDRDQILAFAKSLPAPDQRKVDVPVPAWGTRPELDIPMPGRNQAHLMLIFKTAPDTSPDTPALDLLETSLGGMGGPLFRDLRDKQGLGYTVTAFNRQTSENGYMVFYIGTEPGKMAQAEEGFKRIINDLHQISCRKRMLTGARTSSKATTTGTCKASAAVRAKPRP
ncbi:MAG: M16 family metallopeptidase [Bilophila wadsworthia]